MHDIFENIWLVDDNVEEVLAQIGFRSVIERKEEVGTTEERMFEYPEPPDRSIKFGALLKKCGYSEDVLEQYSEAADIEVCMLGSGAALSRSIPSHGIDTKDPCPDYGDPDGLQKGRGGQSLCVYRGRACRWSPLCSRRHLKWLRPHFGTDESTWC